MSTIKQRRAYPKAMKRAVLKAAKNMKTHQVAEDFNISGTTVNNWRRVAKASNPQPKQLAAHIAAQAAIKLYNTPTLLNKDGKVCTAKPRTATHIQYRGKLVSI